MATSSAPGGRRLRDKLIAVLLGLLCAGLLLELGVRMAGVSFLRRQQRHNAAALDHPGAYRILCLGDSMTAGNYPKFIEEDLNERAGGARFSVIDEARPATTSRDTLATLPAHLARYRPDLVVVMMGANDPSWPVPYGRADWKPLLKSLRLGRFLRYLAAPRRARPAASAKPAPANAAPLTSPGLRLLHQGRTSEAIATFEQALASSPEDPDALSGLAECYAALGKNERAGSLFRRAASG
ncbi:MAG: GDSL-type esterase/lipase family protein, partial [Elusimicrobia bacterium]|nr:GDSL-type esterase/lipase family protein [Elusimicrobiota bacterium]